MTTFTQVSNDITNRSQSWFYTSVWTHDGDTPGTVRIEIRANAYKDQSDANINVWSPTNGWLFHASVPTSEWYDDAPRYVKRHLDEDDETLFDGIQYDLLHRYAKAILYTADYKIVALES